MLKPASAAFGQVDDLTATGALAHRDADRADDRR